LEPSGLRLFLNRLRGRGISAEELCSNLRPEMIPLASSEALREHTGKHRPGGPSARWCEAELNYREQWRRRIKNGLGALIIIVGLAVAIATCART
jgi:hypothetical protein